MNKKSEHAVIASGVARTQLACFYRLQRRVVSYQVLTDRFSRPDVFEALSDGQLIERALRLTRRWGSELCHERPTPLCDQSPGTYAWEKRIVAGRFAIVLPALYALRAPDDLAVAVYEAELPLRDSVSDSTRNAAIRLCELL